MSVLPNAYCRAYSRSPQLAHCTGREAAAAPHAQSCGTCRLACGQCHPAPARHGFNGFVSPRRRSASCIATHIRGEAAAAACRDHSGGERAGGKRGTRVGVVVGHVLEHEEERARDERGERTRAEEAERDFRLWPKQRQPVRRHLWPRSAHRKGER